MATFQKAKNKDGEPMQSSEWLGLLGHGWHATQLYPRDAAFTVKTRGYAMATSRCADIYFPNRVDAWTVVCVSLSHHHNSTRMMLLTGLAGPHSHQFGIERSTRQLLLSDCLLVRIFGGPVLNNGNL